MLFDPKEEYNVYHDSTSTCDIDRVDSFILMMMMMMIID